MSYSSNKIIAVIFAAIFISLSVWGFSVFKNRNSSPTDNAEEIKQPETQAEEQTQEESADEQADESEIDTDSSDQDENSDEDLDEEFSDDEDTAIEKTNLLEISSKDCSNECEDFDDSEEFKYCKEVCGLNSEYTGKKDESSNDCDDLSGLKKDYCLKDLAISEKDFAMCKEIEDAGILKVCRNRITEDIIDSQK
ncbi:MAG TPA: hypothetical protein P5323_01815 [Candidatus Moranbacteria bacterium]|nr:hypothetical protein [Candidatus Moranbacteria bacterium]HSA08416.1 hypothetical protein [Candidatus Moranbacteria bacterium]